MCWEVTKSFSNDTGITLGIHERAVHMECSCKFGKHNNPVLYVVLALFLISPGIQDEYSYVRLRTGEQGGIDFFIFF